MRNKLLVLVMAAVMALTVGVLSACSGSNPNVGMYKLDTMMGMTADEWQELAGQDVSEMFSIELKDGDKAVFTIDGEATDLKWKLDGEKFTLTDDTDTLEGTLKDGVITIEQDGLEMTFKKADSK